MKYRNHLIIALMSITLIALELVWTRIFSAEMFYTFAFLILSLAVLGLGMGALALRLFPFLNREGWLPASLTLAGLCALIGPAVVFRLELDFSVLLTSPVMVAKLVATVAMLSSVYVLGGIALASLFKRSHNDMPTLYMADLAGAGVGVVLIIWLMNTFGTPTATFIGVLPILFAATIAGRKWSRLAPIALAILACSLSPYSSTLLEATRQERAPVIYKHWDSMAKIKLFDYGGEARGINIDNVANSPVYAFDGDFAALKAENPEWGINVSNLIGRFDSCTFLSLGAGGGGDVIQALVEGASSVHAVEVNPHLNRMMQQGDPSGYIDPDTQVVATPKSQPAKTSTTHDAGPEGSQDAKPPVVPVIRDESGKIITLADFSGNLYDDPRVKVVSEDARTYVRRYPNKFDVIYSLSSNTWAALGSGSFAFAESYLFTTEAIIDYWNALTKDGFLSLEHQVYMPRIVPAVIDALKSLGVKQPTDHFAVYNLPQMRRNLLLLSKQPLTDEIRNNAYGKLTTQSFDKIHLLYPVSTLQPAPSADKEAKPGSQKPPLKENLINRIVTKGWRQVAGTSPVDVSPSTDDRPFVAQMGLWRNFTWEGLKEHNFLSDFKGFPLSKSIIVFILGFVVLLVLPLNFLPYLRRGKRLQMTPWLYFFAIGAGFMSVEVVLIQKYSLFIGASVYSIGAVLLTLLVCSGIGSRFSRQVGDTIVFAAIVSLLILDVLLSRHITQALGGLTIMPRTIITGLLVAPLGFFLGMPFPKATARVGDLIDWGFAVNGAASVLGATLTVLIVFAAGFDIALLCGALLYAAAWLLLRRKQAW